MPIYYEKQIQSLIINQVHDRQNNSLSKQAGQTDTDMDRETDRKMNSQVE